MGGRTISKPRSDLSLYPDDAGQPGRRVRASGAAREGREHQSNDARLQDRHHRNRAHDHLPARDIRRAFPSAKIISS